MRRPYSLACLEFARSMAKAAMSAPAAKAFSPAPRTTTQRSDSSFPSSFASNPSRSHIARSSAFMRPGLLAKELGNDERSEEHTSELQSRLHLVCRLLLEKKKKKLTHNIRM